MVRPTTPVTALPRLILFSRSMTQPTLIEALNLAFAVSPEFQYRTTDSVDLMKEIVSRSTRAVILANCITKEDVTDLYNALPAMSGRVAEGTLRVLVLNTLRHPKLPELLRVRCAVEVIELPATEKNLHYKIRNSLMSVHQSYLKKSKLSQSSPERTPDTEILWQPPVEFKYDFWWLANPNQIRRVVGVWLIDLVGPGPNAGTWEEEPALTQGDEKAWVWKTRWLADELFQSEGGRWVFFGNRPEFTWQKAMWSFVSKSPRMGYFPNESSAAEYIRFQYQSDEGLIFFLNSKTTQALLPRIQATLENRVDPVRDRVVADDLDVVNQFEALEPDNATPVRSVLEPKADIGLPYGLGPITAEGVSAGAGAYAKTGSGVEVIRKNGKLGTADLLPPKIFEVTRTNATLLLEPPLAKIGDRFHFRFCFDLGEKRTECLMEWELMEIETEFENQLLATGEFISGDFGHLDHALSGVEERRRQMREFYLGARG